jgi:hypothetical protein
MNLRRLTTSLTSVSILVKLYIYRNLSHTTGNCKGTINCEILQAYLLEDLSVGRSFPVCALYAQSANIRNQDGREFASVG